MSNTFSKILETHITGSKSYQNTQTHICLAINEYFNCIMAEAMINGKFFVNGAITTYAAGATSPVIGVVGTVNSYYFAPMTQPHLYTLFKLYGFYKGLCKAIDEILTMSIIYFDIKSIGALVPMPGQILINYELFNEWLEKNVHLIKCNSKYKWFNAMDTYFENIWKFVIPQIIPYTSPVPIGVFNGTILISGLYI